jgi:hypothetical protein
MPFRAPTSYHLDLYRYWLAKRSGRTMPARRDLNPGDICQLLPYLTIVEKVDGEFHYRLFGTAAADQLGRDLTGGIVGSYVGPQSAAALRAVSERVFTAAHPVFATGEFKTASGAIHNMSVLILPLSDDDADVNMTVSTRVARLSLDVRAGIDWLKGAPLKVGDVVKVSDTAELEKLCLDWEQQCSIGDAAIPSAG